MNLVQTLILSFTEGVSEFLPVSSTGHLVLVSQILGVIQTEFVKSFEIIIQLGAILAVVILYYKKLLDKKVWLQIFLAFIPSATVGFILYKFIKDILIGNSWITVIAMLLGGIAFILIEIWHRKKDIVPTSIEKISNKNAFIIGLFQSVSIIPGVSRAGSTILGALIVGIDRKTAAEFSFILAVPTIAGASALDIFETKLSFSSSELITLIIGFIASFIFAYLSVKWLIKYLQKHSFIAFGVYRIIASVVFYLIFLR
ncbi:MAG: undecaprenyl-diphosphatase UppP [Patescibacteria group bacterium]